MTDAIRSKCAGAVPSTDFDAVLPILGSGMAAAYQRVQNGRLMCGRGATTRSHGLTAGCHHRHPDRKRAVATLGERT